MHPAPLRLALLWHMHQPSYKDPTTGELALPWVRLHSTRAYFDMAWLLERHETIKATFNFVPILIEQLRIYLETDRRDRYWHLTAKPAAALTEADTAFLVRHFFSVHHDTCIRPKPRYWSLLSRRAPDGTLRGTLSEAEARDLQVHFNLAWFGFAAREIHPLINELELKGRDFSEAEKLALLDVQMAVLAQVLPMYRRLVARGQIEVTATPYHHPILPLIIDTETMARCMPDSPRPQRFAWPSDAERHIARALDAHTEAFGERPLGMWPAEGAVSPEAVALFANAGVRWIATDEAQLWGSLPNGGSGRADLYRPYALDLEVSEGQSAQISTVFRDRELSDLLSFTYSRNTAQVAVDDLMQRLHQAHAACEGSDEPPFVVIALDGENPWEYYPDSGRPFLELLYQTLERTDAITTVRIAEHLEAAPPKRTLRRFHSGSWINGDYGIWIGGQMENKGWRLLGQTRQFFENIRGTLEPSVAETALDHLMQAEGSDWFWWYGEPFSSENDRDFDELFRGHLRQVYALADTTPPSALDRSLYPPLAQAVEHTPRTFVTPRFDRPSTYFDWAGAGICELVGPASSMYQAVTYFGRLRYGFDLTHLYLRLEPIPDEPLPELEGLTLHIRLQGHEDHHVVLPLDDADSAGIHRISPDMDRGAMVPLPLAKVEHAVVELGVPFNTIQAAADDSVRIVVRLLRGRVELDRYPARGEVQLRVPDEGFELANWTI